MPRRAGEAALAITGAVLLAVLLLRPLPWRPQAMPRYVGTTASMDNADRDLNAWILAWTARAASSGGEGLFDGNVYFPARNVLAGSETMLAQLPVTVAAWRLAGTAPAVLLAQIAWGLVGTGLAVYLLVRACGGAPWVATLAAAATALEPGRIDRLGLADGLAAQPQYLGFQWAPLAMAAAVACVRGRRASGFVGTAVALALQALACFYLGYYAFVAVPAWAAVLWSSNAPDGRRARAFSRAAAVAAVAAVIVLPVALRYVEARSQGVLRAQDPQFVRLGSLPAVGVRGMLAWCGPLSLLLGAAGLVSLAVSRPRGRRAPTTRGAIAAATAVAATGFVLALGPDLEIAGRSLPLPHGWLAAVVPGFGVLRAPLRALTFATLGLSVAGALALGTAGTRLPRSARAVVAAAGVALAALWIGRQRVPIEPSPLAADLPPVYAWLAAQPVEGGVLEVPGAVAEEDLGGLVREARAMLHSTVHWHPIVNGYTGYPPAWGELAKSLAHRLPERDALQSLVNLAPVSRVILHRRPLGRERADAWEADARAAGLVERARFGEDVVYDVTLPPDRDWRDAPNAQPARETLLGTSIAPLSQDCALGSIEADVPVEMRIALGARSVPVSVANRGGCRWPGLAVRPEGLVVVRASWADVPADSTPPVLRSRLPRDLGPGETARLDAFVMTPRTAGPHRLRLALGQEGAAEPIAVVEREVNVLPARPREAAPGGPVGPQGVGGDPSPAAGATE
ncbi:MAG: hypothetical protein ACKPBU_12805 [Alphaproteobacteria bacterium]